MVREISIVEAVQVDHQRLTDLKIRLGPAGSGITICNAMDGLALQLARINTALKQHHFAGIDAAAKLITTISDRIGLITLAHVAGDVGRLANTDNTVALAACSARLMRVGEASMIEMWNTKNMLP